MQCKCGGETHDTSHEVKTDGKAKEWTGFDIDPPIQVVQTKCSGCGRIMVKVFKQGRLIAKKG